jgi:hypothetical protein
MADFDPAYEPGSPVPQAKGLGAAADAADCRLELQTKGHHYVLRYRRGEERKVLAGLLEMARDPENPLNLFDAALLSHQMGLQLSRQIKQMLKKP